MLTARLASTVLIIQRCTSMKSGRPARKAAIDPAVTAISALTVTLMTICRLPKTSDCSSTLPTPVG